MRHIIIPLFMLLLNQPSALGQCLAPTAFEYLDVNNVKARINANMSLWWDLQGSANYEVPAGSGKHSIFSGAPWLGGIDNSNQLRLAAMRYGANGHDFYSGPLSAVNAQVAASTCAQYDRIWKLERWQVAEFMERYDEPGYNIPQEILEWPAHGDLALGEAYDLAPFVDVDGDNVYNPFAGDYPAFRFDGQVDMDRELLGDQVLWWIINDNGNVHQETNGLPIGVEMQCMAYAFKRCDVFDDQTFYRYRMINRGTHTLTNSYIGQVVDGDLGFYQDDFVGCDVQRGIGFNYNANQVDGQIGAQGHYGTNPPACGIDILKGPLKDMDGVDDDNDGIIDNETHGMSKFLYFNNTGQGNPSTQDPDQAQHYYNFMQGIWKDGQNMCYGGNGHPSGDCSGTTCSYMYPGDSDPDWVNTNGIAMPFEWTEEQAGNLGSDRRFVISSGPFTFFPGSVQTLHLGVIWARDTTGNDPVSIQALKNTDDLVQAAFDTKFQNLGSCPPEAAITYQQPGTFLFYFTSMWEGDSYLWDFGDGSTSTARFPNHIFPDYGTYHVCLTVTNGSGTSTQCMDIEVAVGSTGIAGGAFPQPEVRLMPNPATDRVTILVRSGSCTGYKLLDALGREVQAEQFTTRSVRFDVEVSHLPSGIYTVMLETQAGPAVARLVRE